MPIGLQGSAFEPAGTVERTFSTRHNSAAPVCLTTWNNLLNQDDDDGASVDSSHSDLRETAWDADRRVQMLREQARRMTQERAADGQEPGLSQSPRSSRAKRMVTLWKAD